LFTFTKPISLHSSRNAWALLYDCLLAMKNIDSVASLILAQEMRVRLLEVCTYPFECFLSQIFVRDINFIGPLEHPTTIALPSARRYCDSDVVSRGVGF
jgi:hypothetical protein